MENLTSEYELLDRPALEALAARICSAASVSAVAQARLVRWIGEFDAHDGAARMESGWAGTAGWLQFTCSMTPLVAREHVRIARALRVMPTVAALFEAGRLSYSKVRAATRLVGELDERHLAQLALTLTAGELEVSLSTYRRVSGHRLAQQGRRSASWRTDADGYVRVTVCLPAEEGAVVVAAIEAARDRQPIEEKSTPDAILDLAHTYLDTRPDDVSGADRTSVVVVVDAAQLALGGGMVASEPAPRTLPEAATTGVSAETSKAPHPVVELPDPGPAPALPNLHFGPDGHGSATWGRLDPEPAFTEHGVRPTDPAMFGGAVRALRAGACHVEGHGGIEPATAARLSCDARRLVGMIVDADGDVLHHGRTKRLVTPHLRRALMVRDQGVCQFPGCHQRRYLDAHHIEHWIVGGLTELDNLILLCRRHHTWTHEGQVSIECQPSSVPRWVFHYPDGSRVDPDQPALSDDQLARVLAWHHGHTDLDDRWAPQARRLVPKTGGTTFSLAHAVDALFGMRLVDAA